jgi:hypothetical protein
MRWFSEKYPFAVAGMFALALLHPGAQAIAQTGAKPSMTEVERQAYWYSRYNLNAMTLMSGFGLRMKPPPAKVKKLGSIARFDPRRMPKNPYLLRAIYAAGDPHFQQTGDFGDLSTLYWNRDRMVKRFEPAAQAFTIVKAVSKGLRTEYHRQGKDRFIALVQLQEAKALAGFLAKSLTGKDGLVAARNEGAALEPPNAWDQAAALWAYSSLSLALTDSDLPLYSRLPTSASEAAGFSTLGDSLFRAMAGIEPGGVRDVAVTIQAYGWFAAATRDAKLRGEALRRTALLGRRLAAMPKNKFDDLAFAVYGLGEAARLSGDQGLARQAQRIFFEQMEKAWDPVVGAYAPEPGSTAYSYSPERVAAVLAAIHTIRLFNRPGVGSPWDPSLADRRYAAFFTNVVVKSGLQQAHAIPLAVNPIYAKAEPRSYFTAAITPLSTEGDGRYGLCPVYAARVVFDDKQWTVTDRTFRPAGAMFLSVVSTSRRGADPDGFIPLTRLAGALAQDRK